MPAPLSVSDASPGAQAAAMPGAIEALDKGLASDSPSTQPPCLLRIKALEAMPLKAPIELKAGEILALLGLDHSTCNHLVSFLSGDRQPLTDRLYYLGQDLAAQPLFWSKERPPEILVIPPEGSLLANFNAWENIWLAVCYHRPGQAPQLMNEVFQITAQLGLDESWPIRKPGSLDNWQRQAISCARAITLEPRLLVLNALFEGADQTELTFAKQLFKVLKTHRPQTAVLYLGDSLVPGIQIKRLFLDI